MKICQNRRKEPEEGSLSNLLYRIESIMREKFMEEQITKDSLTIKGSRKGNGFNIMKMRQ
jgi:hypothetical protein